MFKLGDTIIDRLLFGYGAKSNGTPMYALTQLSQATMNITAESQDVNDKDGNLIYRKYYGKKGDISAQNAFMNLAIVETLSAIDAEIATNEKGIVMPMIATVKAGKTLDITGYVEGTVVVNALEKGAMGREYALGSNASETEFAIKTADTTTLELPTDSAEVEYIVKYKKTVHSGAKITNSADKFPECHELFFKALAVDMCNKDIKHAVIIHIPSFMPSPEFSLALAGGDNQQMDYTGAMMVDYCSPDKELFSIYYIDEPEDF